MTEDYNTQADTILRQALVWDNHACMPLRPNDNSFMPQLDRLRRAHVNVVSLNIGFGPIPLENHLRTLAGFRKWIAANSEHYALASTANDVSRAKREKKLAVIFDIEGLAPFDRGDHGLMELFAALGVRWALIAYNKNNKSGGGCLDDDIGLTRHGRALLSEMKRVGVAVCCSHTGRRTALDVMEHADNPVVFSHSNSNALQPHPRNICDALIKACAETGGVVGVNGIGQFLGPTDHLPAQIVRHIDHIVQTVGPDHAGLGLDYLFDPNEIKTYLQSMPDIFPEDISLDKETKMAPPECLGDIVAGLLRLGYDRRSIEKILGGNWRRIADTVWRNDTPAAIFSDEYGSGGET